jgi:hypothetical protein
MMRFQITGQGRPLQGGAALAPAGTVIDSTSNDHWSLFARGLIPPPNATALGTEAWVLMQRSYPELRHLMGSRLKAG